MTSAQKWDQVTVLPEKEDEFAHALSRYRAENFEAAYREFDFLTKSERLHQRMTASFLLAGKSLMKLARYAEAILYFDRLIDLFPQSNYADDALLAEASCHYHLSNYLRSVQNLFLLVDWSSDEALLTQTEKLANIIMRQQMNLEELRSLKRFAKGEGSSALLVLNLAERELTLGSTEKAIEILQDYKGNYGSSKYISEVDELLDKAKTPGTRSVKIGVVLPLSGYFSEEGLGVLRGIRFAQL
ncbi:tetratricopeptide repeat protein, partial [bacterium]|nr:tetratricopeptide repeat protein [bacterium]